MIEIKNLVKIYNKGKTNEFCALKGIDLSIEEGEMVAIIGKSGAGKSTLLHILAAIDSYDKGSYLVDGVSDRKSTRLNSSHKVQSRMPSSA